MDLASSLFSYHQATDISCLHLGWSGMQIHPRLQSIDIIHLRNVLCIRHECTVV
jgi:hypothetical protein